MNRRPTHTILLTLAACSLVLALAPGAAQSQPVPFACTGEAFVVQDPDAELFQIDQTITPFVLVPLGDANSNGICDPTEACELSTAIEVNNLGFRRTDGLLYGVQVNLGANTNAGIIQIDSNGTVFGPTIPTPAASWPTTGFNAGDVSPDGSVLYVNQSGRGTLYRVALPALTFTSVAIAGFTGANNVVLDWAHHPTVPFLFGADRDGQVARLDPATGTRVDFTVAGLPGGGMAGNTDYGGAWFDASGNLFLFDNSGQIFEVSITNPASATPTFTVVGSQSGPASSRNDATACIQDVIGVGKHMSSALAGFPDTVTIDYVFENLSGTDTLSNLSAFDDLTAVFGTRGTGGTCAAPVPAGADWFFVSISSSPAAFANPSYNGDPTGSDQLINQAPTQSLAAGASATAQVIITLCNQENATPPNPPGTGGPPYLFFNSVLFTGTNPAGNIFGDISHDDGTTTPDPDPNMDGSPDENVPAQVPVELMSFEID